MSFSPTYGCSRVIKTVKELSDMINKKELNPDLKFEFSHLKSPACFTT